MHRSNDSYGVVGFHGAVGAGGGCQGVAEGWLECGRIERSEWGAIAEEFGVWVHGGGG